MSFIKFIQKIWFKATNIEKGVIIILFGILLFMVFK